MLFKGAFNNRPLQIASLFAISKCLVSGIIFKVGSKPSIPEIEFIQ